MYMCFRGINVASVSTICRLDCGSVPTLWYIYSICTISFVWVICLKLHFKQYCNFIVARCGLVIRTFRKCPVGRSDEQHINEQRIDLIGDGCPGLFYYPVCFW